MGGRGRGGEGGAAARERAYLWMAKCLGTALKYEQERWVEKKNCLKKKQTKQNKTKQNKTKQNKTKQNKTKQNKTKQNKRTII